ncbi:hypothetical protein D3C77_791720 [compost metagenome]
MERGIASGELVATTDAKVLGTLFNSFLLGVSLAARDGVRYPVFDAAITQLMLQWDAARAPAS